MSVRRAPNANRDELAESGELLAVEAIDRTGLIVTSEGAFVRIFRVVPPNPLLMSSQERAKTAATFHRLISQLKAEETVQIYVDARPVNLAELLTECKREVEASAGPAPTAERPARDRIALAQWRLYAALEESLRLHADEQAAVQVSAYVVVPFTPRQTAARAALAWVKRGRLALAPLERPLQAHRRAVREHLAHVDALRAELEAEGMPTDLLDGDRVLRLLWARFNPTKADIGRHAPTSTVEVLGELDAPSERDVARRAAVRLKAQIAQSSLDFRSSHDHATVERDAEQTILVHNTVGRTQMGWLHGAMLTRQPFTLSVYIHALERRRERQKLKMAYRRMFTINRGAEQRGRVPDFDRYVQEHEYEQLLGEMASGEQASLARVSIYQTLRARGPAPDLAALSEAVDFCAEAIESVGDCKVNRGEFRQHELWLSSLPLGRDVHGRARKYPTANTADMVPLVGTKCGSPTGIPFAFADPGRTVELLNPYDEEHSNYTMVIAGRSGSGKALDVETPLPTPNGWTTMGDLRLGDQLYDDAGHTCRVTGIFDQPPGRPCFEVVFSDGSTIVADAEHRWLTHDYKARRAARYRATTTKRPLDMMGGTSRFRGVTRHRDGRWVAQVQTGGLNRHLGLFADEETAAATAHEARRRLLNSQSPAPSVVTTEEIRRSLRHGKDSNHAIPVTKPLVGHQAELPVAPYTLGVWLGDGSSHHATIFSDDSQVTEMIAADGYEVKRYAAPFAYGVSIRVPKVADARRACALCERSFAPRRAGQRFCSRSCASRSGTSQRNQCPPACARCGGPLGAQAKTTLCKPCVRATNPNSILRSLGLLGNKHIPTSYLRASEPQRRALLAGLLDTDGCVTAHGGINFDSTNDRLARDVRELALTLGYRATLITKRATLDGRDCGPAYRVSLTTSDDVFRLERKRKLLRERSSRHKPERTRYRYVVDVRPVPSRPVRCITVDSPSRLFLAGEAMVPTHNTMTANVILSRCLALGARAFVIDRAGHYEILTRLLESAQQIEIGADDSPYALNPWDVADPSKVSREKIAFLLALHQVMMGGLDARQIGLIGAAIRAVYAKAAALPGCPPRESMLRDELRAQAAEAQQADAVDVAATLRNLADRLSEYCGDGTYAYLLDRETTVPRDAQVVVFDTRRCPESELRLVMFQVMEYVTSTVQRHWEEHKSAAAQPGAPLFLGRSIMLIDEAWHLISRPETGAYANNLARRARHLGLTLIVMSQQLSDFDTEHGVALLGNSSQQLLLAQNPKEIPFIQDAVQLSDREAEELHRLKTVKGRHAQMLWLNGTRGHGKVALRVGPTEYWAYTSDPSEVAIREAEIAKQHGNVWAAIGALARRGTRAHRDVPVTTTRDERDSEDPASEAA